MKNDNGVSEYCYVFIFGFAMYEGIYCIMFYIYLIHVFKGTGNWKFNLAMNLNSQSILYIVGFGIFPHIENSDLFQ